MFSSGRFIRFFEGITVNLIVGIRLESSKINPRFHTNLNAILKSRGWRVYQTHTVSKGTEKYLGNSNI